MLFKNILIGDNHEKKNLYSKGYFKKEVPFKITQLPCLRYNQRFLGTYWKGGAVYKLVRITA